MSILSYQIGEAGLSGVKPRVIYIETNDTLAAVTAPGYLNTLVDKFQVQLQEYDMALVSTKTTPSAASTQVAWLEVTKSGNNWSLTTTGSPGSVVLPTTANYLAHFTNTTGELSSAPASVINPGNIQAGLSGTAGTLASFPATPLSGSLKVAAVANAGNTDVTISNAAHGQATVISIPDGGQATTEFIIADSAGTQHITSGSLQVDAGILSSGLAAGGTAGRLDLYAPTTANGILSIVAVDAGADFDTTISNAASVGQDQVITIPDAGAATANFLLDSGSANLLAHQQFVGLESVLTFGTGTWTITRIAQGNYVARHTPADETSIIAIDITPMIRTAASKGFRLDSFDVIYAIAANPLDAHTVTLDRIEYANNVAVSVNNIAITGALATATQANPYVTNVAVDTPAFDNTANSKYVIEVTVDNAAASEYDFYGIMMRFTQTVA